MKLTQLIEFVRTRLKLFIRLGLAALGALVLLDLVPGLINKEHAHTAIEHVPGFWALFGFAGCVVIIILSKAFGHAGIMQREDYYDE